VIEEFPAVRVAAGVVSLATHRTQVNDEHNRLLASMEAAFRKAGYEPPAPADVMRSLCPDPAKARSCLEALIKSQRLVRIADQLVFHSDVVQHIKKSLAAHKGRHFSVPEFKEWTHVSRKFAIPLLEHLDRQRVTKREGDMRVVL
jgi:selenocysteine-specific elongation factor